MKILKKTLLTGFLHELMQLLLKISNLLVQRYRIYLYDISSHFSNDDTTVFDFLASDFLKIKEKIMNDANRSIVPCWLTERAVANMLSCSVSALQKHRFKNRGIPYVKFGKSVRYCKEDVINFMDNQKVIPSSGSGILSKA